MEALASLLSRAVQLGDIEGISAPGDGPIISHMLYVDDALIMGYWSPENIVQVTSLLRIFYIVSGMKINAHKSFLYGVGIPEAEVRSLADSMGCSVGVFPFQYQGIKNGANMNRISHWDTVIEKVRSRLQSWKAKVLSIGGRITLIKSDGKGVHWVAWEVVTRPKNFGGLGISKISEVNASLLVKWAWRFINEHESMWRKVIISLHGGRNKWAFVPVKKSLGGVWKSIVSVLNKVRFDGRRVEDLFYCKLGDGSRIDFWKDVWFGSTPLYRRWPLLFSADRNKNVTVVARLKT
ncbi:uncharacterized protein LOC143622474 [Bidens hawaiensis]|uniref:uncharacterized protein LOC143622474 n=1 Tax=Bidens hawaiensis TaxID=980011 RepID=UPI00404A9D1F